MSRLIDRIYVENPYAGFPLDQHAPDVQGWGSHNPIFRGVVDAFQPKIIIEVGSWKGASAITLADHCKNAGIDTEIICVDTWLGSIEHWLEHDKEDFFPSLRLLNGYPQLFYTFMRNVIEAGHVDMITPLPMPSLQAAKFLERHQVKADLIYLDSSHDYSSVKSDLEAYSKLLSKEAVILCDDYIGWKSVTEAVNDFVLANNWHVVGERGKALISPSRVAKLSVNRKSEA